MPEPGEGPEPSRAARTSAARTRLTGSVRRGLTAWRDALRKRDVAIAALGIGLAVAGGLLLATRDRTLHEINVGERASRLKDAVWAGVNRPLEALSALHSFFLAEPDVTRAKFRSFVQPLLKSYKRSVYALEWVPIVRAGQRSAFEAEARAAGLSGYHFWTTDERERPLPMDARPEYAPIHYMEPPNLGALGFDVESSPPRWTVAQRACTTGQAAASRRFALLEDLATPGGRQIYSIAVYQPVFPSLEPPPSPEARRAELRGFLLAVFRIRPLVEAAITTASTDGLRYALWDRTEESGEPDLLFESEAGARAALSVAGAKTVHSLSVPLADRHWELHVASTANPLATATRGASAAVAGVVLVLAALGGVTSLRAVARLRRQVERVGPYTLVGRLGGGAMGVVYEARHALLRRPTAIKLLAPGVAGERALARFEREVQLTASLTHPSTIAIYDYGRTDKGVFYYAMELIRGFNLHQLVTIEGPLPPGRVVHLMTQVCGALAEAHAAGLIHRDVKPANLMVSVVGGIPDFLKVLDFGLVKDLAAATLATPAERDQPPALSTAVSQDGSLLGTPLFLAPEGVTNPGAVDARLDIYALGAVAYFLLSGELPFHGATAIEIYARQRRGPPPPLSRSAGPPVPQELEELIFECLEFSQEKRPATAREVSRRLSSCPVEPWTEAMALTWWEERGPAVLEAARAAGDLVTPGTITTDSRRLAPARHLDSQAGS
jgi:CHASE1-domain containing sensor protein